MSARLGPLLAARPPVTTASPLLLQKGTSSRLLDKQHQPAWQLAH